MRITHDAKETIPSFGDIKSSKELGYKHDNGSRFIWHACELCGKGSWVQIVKGEPVYKRCVDCARKDGRDKIINELKQRIEEQSIGDSNES